MVGKYNPAMIRMRSPSNVFQRPRRRLRACQCQQSGSNTSQRNHRKAGEERRLVNNEGQQERTNRATKVTTTIRDGEPART